MALRRRGGGSEAMNPWPGFVDALSTLLMVIIFVLLVFVLAQAFLSVTLAGRNRELASLTSRVAQLSDMLSLEKGREANLQLALSQIGQELAQTSTARDKLAASYTALQARAGKLSTDLASAQAARASLAASLAAAKAAQEELARTVKADKATIELKLGQVAQLDSQVAALTALRDQLEKQVRDAAARTLTEQQRKAAIAAQLADEQKFSTSAKAQIALLNQQLDQLRQQLASLATALDVSEKSSANKDVQIANLGKRLNAALAQKVQQLQQYRSEFFGELRKVLAGRPGIRIVGDRFVFQSEVLFASGSAELSSAGLDQITALAITLKHLIPEIPSNVHWILRVDGHADRQRLGPGSPFTSNWELSAARAITVVKTLIADGVPANHLAAAAFGSTEPIDPAHTPAAYARNRRIELRLTDQ
ncbi:MAG: peptidoglycan -binding protein [Rhodospirillales bacterium]|nr:peptidoglycan -binding protein [Rhodospirillales bacterium]